MARKGDRKLNNLGEEESELTASELAELEAEMEGNWGTSEFEDQGEWNPD
jgi:hypothetical protein